MASLLQEELFERRGQAPAPSKDFCQLLVTRRQVLQLKILDIPKLCDVKLYDGKPENQTILKCHQNISFILSRTFWASEAIDFCFEVIYWSYAFVCRIQGDTRPQIHERAFRINKVKTTLTINCCFIKYFQVIFRWWRISLRNECREARPGELKESHEDFLDDSSLQIQIAIIFGAKVLEHVLNLCRGKFDFLERLPVPLLLYIISFLELEDIARLSQVSHRLKMICNSNALWEGIVENLCDTITPEMRELAQETGWKQLFFTNRLQLQLQLRRRRQKHAEKEKLTE